MAAPVNPKTVGELIENLKLYPLDWPISFSPFTLYRTKDRGEHVHFEMNEAQGQDLASLNTVRRHPL